MICDIVDVKVVGVHALFLKFEDGKSGYVNLEKLISFKGVFKPLKDKNYFSKVYLNTELGTICWGNGADLAPSFLYVHLSHSAPPKRAI